MLWLRRFTEGILIPRNNTKKHIYIFAGRLVSQIIRKQTTWLNTLYQTTLLKPNRMEPRYCWAINQNWIFSITKVLKTMASNAAWHVNLSRMSNALLHTLSCTPGSLLCYSMCMPLISYILICNSRSRSNLPESLLTRMLLASVSLLITLK